MPSNQTFSPVKASRRLILRARFAQQQHADGHKMVRARVYLLSGCFGVSREAVGPNGQLIVNLIPEVEFIIGKQPPVPDLPPQDAQNRFQMVFRRFLGAFARPEHPLALFLDDLQWLDAEFFAACSLDRLTARQHADTSKLAQARGASQAL